MFRKLRPLIFRQRRDHGVEIPVPRHLGQRVGATKGGGFTDEAVHHLVAKLLVRLLSAAEAQFDVDLAIITEKADRMVQLHAEVIWINAGRQLDLLHLIRRLPCIGVFLLLRLLVLEFPVLDDAADRRGRGGRDLDQVEALGLRQPEGVGQ